MEYISSSSIVALVKEADLIVKFIMAFLFFLSIFSWTIIFDKFFKFSLLNIRTNRFEELFNNSENIDVIFKDAKRRGNHPLALIFLASMGEWKTKVINELKNSQDTYKIQSLKNRIEGEMYVSLNRSLKKIEKGLNLLAIIGSTAPFIGLFGTVWGIMNSFQGIAVAKSASLSVVAPGIAEALLATAIGLFAAIPAVFFYNYFSNKINNFYEQAEGFSMRLLNLLSRELDR